MPTCGVQTTLPSVRDRGLGVIGRSRDGEWGVGGCNPVQVMLIVPIFMWAGLKSLAYHHLQVKLL